jgi:fructose 5-dehydrogenase small subunit
MRNARPAASSGLARRELLALIGAAAAGLAGGAMPGGAQGAEGQSTLARFLDVSRLLTRRRALDAVLGRRIYEELSPRLPRFDFRIDAMRRFIDAGGHGDVETLMASLDREDRDLAGLARSVIAAWYTGVAGDGPDARLVAYQNALMFDTVRDTLPVPSYCHAAPGSWAQRPPAV